MFLKYIFRRHLKKRAAILLIVCIVSAIFVIVCKSMVNEDLDSKSRNSGKIYAPEDIVSDHRPKASDARIEASRNSSVYHPQKHLNIWSIVGLGDYTWEHILGGGKGEEGGIAELNVGDLILRYQSGSLSWEDLSPDTTKLLLILNGRAPERLPETKMWLDTLDSLPQLQSSLLMIIGDEECNNNWLLPYLSSYGGPLKRVFISYDTEIVDGKEVIQWPLGTATYRGFPLEDASVLSSDASRPYRCNFMATIYEGSSREKLMEVIQENNLNDYCYVKTRQLWEAEETQTSMEEYVRVLQESDLTLSPVGKNIECYRIYEAAAMGSVPVIEDRRTSQTCSERTLRVLKDRNAPFIFIKDWTELRHVFQEEMKKSPEMIIERRKNLIKWYRRFKLEMKELLVSEIKQLL